MPNILKQWNSNWKEFEHKTKKGFMKIGGFVSRPEDPVFKSRLADLESLRIEVNNLALKVRNVASTSKAYTNSLHGLCTDSVLEEEAYKKEAKFSEAMESSLCAMLNDVQTVTLPELVESIQDYKDAKLKYDAAYHKTLKEMHKRGDNGTDSEARVHGYNNELDGLKQVYEGSKKEVLKHRQVMKGRLEGDVLKSLEVVDKSGAEHHKVFLRHFRKRLINAAALCGGSGRELRPPVLRDDVAQPVGPRARMPSAPPQPMPSAPPQPQPSAPPQPCSPPPPYKPMLSPPDASRRNPSNPFYPAIYKRSNTNIRPEGVPENPPHTQQRRGIL